MQSALSRIWTSVAVSISYDDNHYTMGTCWIIYASIGTCFMLVGWVVQEKWLVKILSDQVSARKRDMSE